MEDSSHKFNKHKIGYSQNLDRLKFLTCFDYFMTQFQDSKTFARMSAIQKTFNFDSIEEEEETRETDFLELKCILSKSILE